jgi:quercetin dioxygenase-like cupin family protein
MIKLFRNIRQSILLLTSIVFFLSSCKNKIALPDPLNAGWNNQSVCEVLQDNAKLRVLKCTFKPGVGHEKHYHNAHFAYTLSGSKMRINDTTGTREVDVATGSSFFSDGVVWHEALNIGDSTAVFLIIEPK